MTLDVVILLLETMTAGFGL